MSLPKFHFNPKTGNVRECEAAYNCRFGSASVHYPSLSDATDGFNRLIAREQHKDKQLEVGSVAPISDGVVRERDYTLPAGEYLLCDPYILIATKDQAGWNNAVESIENQFGWEYTAASPDEEKQTAVGVKYRGEDIGMIKQWHGSGLFWSAGPVFKIPSEAGLIATVPKKVVEDLGYSMEWAVKNRIGAPLEVKEETKVWRDENGLMLVGGNSLIVHNNIVADLFQSLNSANGETKDKRATSETYDRLTMRAKMWREDPLAFHSNIKAQVTKTGRKARVA